jgi:2-oxoisovalerate dehydrogenase E1 component beta subunit
LFFEHKYLYRRIKGEMPAGDHTVPIGKARTAREGKDLSIITYAATVYKALEAAEQLEKEDGLSVEVIDLRSLAPLDDDAIQATVRKTNRVLILHEDTRTGGIAGEITARINESSFAWLDAPVLRVTAHDVPLPYAPSLEDFVLPQTADVERRGLWRRIEHWSPRFGSGRSDGRLSALFWYRLLYGRCRICRRRNDRCVSRQDRRCFRSVRG